MLSLLIFKIFSQHCFDENRLVNSDRKEFQTFKKSLCKQKKQVKDDSLPAGFGEVQLFGQVCSQEEGSSSWAGSTHVRAAGYLLVCKLLKVRMHGFVSPRSWLKLQYKPT